MKKVGIVVVTYNRKELLAEVVAALRVQTFKDFDIIVVNNGSTDGTSKWLDVQNDIITITQENIGGAGGFNTGLKYVAENQYEFCWLMDDDVVCEPNALQELLTAYTTKKDIGFVCSAVYGLNGKAMNVPIVDTRPSENGYPNFYEYISNQMIKVQVATFVSVLLSTNVIKELGLPYKEYFIWGDDSEYTMRISKKYDSYLACKSKVLHKRKIQTSLSFDTESDSRRLRNYFYMFRNNTYNLRLYEGKRVYLRKRLNLYKMAICYFLKGKFSRGIIILKVLFALTSFKPKVEFVSCRRGGVLTYSKKVFVSSSCKRRAA